MDPATGQSRGFGFVLFCNEASIEAILAAGAHEIDGKSVSRLLLIFFRNYFDFQVDPKKAERRDGKMFVGGVKAETTDDTIRGTYSFYFKY